MYMRLVASFDGIVAFSLSRLGETQDGQIIPKGCPRVGRQIGRASGVRSGAASPYKAAVLTINRFVLQ